MDGCPFKSFNAVQSVEEKIEPIEVRLQHHHFKNIYTPLYSSENTNIPHTLSYSLPT